MKDVNISVIVAPDGDSFEAKVVGPWGTSKVKFDFRPPDTDTGLVRILLKKSATLRSQVLANTFRQLLENFRGATIRGRKWSFVELENALKGLPDEVPDEVPDVPLLHTVATLLSKFSAKHTEFTVFNGGPHLCVKVPDGHFTVSCITSEGRKITFAFCPYVADGPAQCVDVLHHTSGVTIQNGATECPIQALSVHSIGQVAYNGKLDDAKPCSLAVISLAKKENTD